MTGGWRLDDQAVLVLQAAVRQGDPEVTGLLERAVDRATAVVVDSTAAEAADSVDELAALVRLVADERRLGDRILTALHLALDQDDLEVSELLERAFEATMTRFGGPDATELRDVPEGMVRAYERLDSLRHRCHQR
ncbi:MAG: hypothetical protein WCO00_08530 [Rhodospirillaceae bacterium]